MTVLTERSALAARAGARPRSRRMSAGRLAAYVIMIGATILWITPIVWALFTALRPYSETSKYGYLSWPRHLTLQNFKDAWTGGDMVHYFWNSVIITVPSVIICLFLASMVAYVLSRFSWWFTVPMLLISSSPATCCRRRCSSRRSSGSTSRSTCRRSSPGAGCSTTPSSA